MKIVVLFKDPNALDEAINQLPAEDQEEAKQAIREWMRYGEYIKISFDTENGSATVLRT